MTIKRIIYCAVASAIICVLSPLSIPSAVPFTLSLFAVYLVGFLLDPIEALTSTIVYILIGVVGMPVFAGFSGGISVVLGPTGGFILAYPLVALIASFEKRIDKILLKILLCILSLAVCYTFGCIVFSLVTGNSIFDAIVVCVLPFIVFDLIKIFVAYFVSGPIRKRLF